MSQNKKIAKNSLILYTRLIVTTIISIITTRIVVRTLGVDDYGLYSVVGSVVLMMNFLNTIMVPATYRFVAFEMGRNEGENVNKVFNISLSIHILIIIIVLLIAETLGIWYINNYLNVEADKVADAIFVFQFSIIATVIRIFSIPFQGFITAIEKFSVRASIEIVRAVCRLLFVILLIYITGNKLRLYAILMAILAIIPTSLFIFYCKYYYGDFVKFKIYKDTNKYKEMLAFSGWTMIGAAAYTGRSTGSPIIVNYFFGTTLNAAYGIAGRVKKFMQMFTQSISQAAIPQIIKSFSGGDYKRTTNLVAYISKYTFLLLMFPSIPILLETHYLMKMWLGEIPEFTVIFVKLFIIDLLIRSLNSGVPAAVQATGKIKWFQIINSTILLLGLPISFLFFKLGFPPYTILVIYIAIALVNIVVGLFLLKILIDFNVKYLLKKSYFRVGLILVSLIPLFLINQIITEESLVRFISSTVLSLLYYAIMVYLIGIEKNERKMLHEGIIKMKNKILRKK